MVAILCEADRSSVAEVAEKHKVSDQTNYAGRKHFAAMAPADMKRVRSLEAENNKLKKSCRATSARVATLSAVQRAPR